MKRRFKLLAAAVGAVMLTALLVILVLPLVVDSKRVHAHAIALVETRTGLDVRIDGGVRLQWLPLIRVTATDVRVANPPGFTSNDFARIGSLALTPALSALLHGRLESEHLELNDTVIYLERDDAGNANWNAAAHALGGSDDTPAVEDEAAAPPATILGGLALHGAHVVRRDAGVAVSFAKVAKVEIQTGAIDTHGDIEDLRVHVSIPADTNAPVVVVEARGSVVDRRLVMEKLEANVRTAEADVMLEGTLRGELDTGRYALEGARVDGTLGRNRHRVRLDADVVLDEDARTLTANALHATLAETRMEGNLEVRTDAALSHITGAFDLVVDGRPVEGDLAVDWSRPALELALKLDAQLGDAPGPYALRGRNDVAVHAMLDARASADSPYRITDLQMIVNLADPSAAGGRLRVTLETDLEIDPVHEHVRANNLHLRIHDSHITGRVEVRGFGTPAVRFDLDADAIDGDRMLPAIAARAGVGSATTPVHATVEAIRALDVTGEMRVGRLAVRGMRLENVRLLAGGDAKGG